ncbi:MAG: hypothetical protein AAF067_10620, partial [Pseudomonadota bacterium]
YESEDDEDAQSYGAIGSHKAKAVRVVITVVFSELISEVINDTGKDGLEACCPASGYSWLGQRGNVHP